jgi:hypothetical protein
MTDPVNGAPSGDEDPEALSGTGGAEEVPPTPEAPKTVDRSIFEATRNQLREADRKRQAAEDRVKQLETKDLPEAEKIKREREELQSENARLKALLQDQAVTNAFLGVTSHEWHDPKAALKLLSREGVEVSEDGTVTGMTDAVKKLAGEYPWMLKPKAAADAEEPEVQRSAGAPPMNGKPGSDKPDAKKLASRFPALRTRTGGR